MEEVGVNKPTHSTTHPPDNNTVVDVHDVHVTDRNNRKHVLSGMLVCCMPCYWLKTNTSLHKASLTVVTLLVTSLLVASPVLFLISSVPANEQPRKECNIYEDEDCLVDSSVPDVPLLKCDTAACKDIARRLRYSLSWDHEPCKNFYNFACGGWSESQKADSSHPYSHAVDLSISTLNKKIILFIQYLIKLNGTSGRFKKIGDFHSSCAASNEKPIDMARMYAVLDQLGGYLPPGSLGPNDLTPLMLSILNVSGTPLFDLSLGSHHKNNSKLSVYIDLPNGAVKTKWSNNQKPHNIFNNNEYNQYFMDHFDWIRKKREAMDTNTPYDYLKVKNIEARLIDLEMIVTGMLPKRMEATEKATEIQNILLFASTVDQLLPGQKQLRYEINEFSETLPYSEQILQEKYPVVNWRTLFEELIPDYNKSKMNIYIFSPSYLKSLSDVMKKFQNRIIHNALLAMYARDFLHHLVDMKSTNSDDLYCTLLTLHTFPYPVSGLYLSHYTEEYLHDIEKRADDMFTNLKLSLFKRVEKATWVDNESRWRIMDNITNLTGRFIAWPSLRNSTIMDQIINSMEISDDFFNNMMNHYRLKRKLQMSTDGLIPHSIFWPYPFVVNAFYDPMDNCVFLPLAILTQPFFSTGVPAYIPYGSVGMILAHEMMHSLDYVGFHSKSVSPLWRDSQSLKSLQTKLSCVATSYYKSPKKGFKFKGKDVQIEFNGNYTLDETTADLSGAQVAWGAWRQLENGDKETTLSHLPLAPSKLFFLTLAQLYCTQITTEGYIRATEENFHMTPLERVNGLVRNTIPFGESYQCSVGAPMNPTTKCHVW